MIASVILSTRNRCFFLKQTVASIIPQLSCDVELLIVNDCSDDDTAAYLYGVDSPWIRVFENSQPQGLTRNLNFLMQQAKGEYIIRIDDDDLMTKDRVQRQVDFVRQHNYDMSWCLPEFIDEHNNRFSKQKNWGQQYVLEMLDSKNMITHVCTIFRRESVLSLGGYSETFITGQDWDLWKRIKTAGLRMGMQQEYLTQVRINRGSVTLNRLGIKDDRTYFFNLLKVCLSNDDLNGAINKVRECRRYQYIPYVVIRWMVGERRLDAIRKLRA
ncbi:glycosyltransferase family 2 protein [Motiliproteus sediminis]|uniref:glycosyltransferase family 2 protein n=1 Tax=Motiliproteus sediminis TaxID=1468178 RepID=UPI001AF0030D|nr:glycosyltransferase family 2 protein [Motiliproteus sediminis]